MSDDQKRTKYKKYMGSQTNQISFPLGGIGTGCIGLAGNGRLIDWEIFNKPNKNSSTNGFSFFAIKGEINGQTRFAKILQGDLQTALSGQGDADWTYGFGVKREHLAGMPHFQSTEFTGTFPIAEIQYVDNELPLDVKLTAFNPFIPLNDKDSSIPTAIFTFEVKNNADEALDISLAGSISNPFERGAKNTYVELDNAKAIQLYSEEYTENDIEYGDITLSTSDENTSYQSYWYRGEWFDNLTVFWNDFTKPGPLEERFYPEPSSKVSWNATVNFKDVATIMSTKKIAPGQTTVFTYVITWNIPNFNNYWNPGENPVWKNYYSSLFKDSLESTVYTWHHYERLYNSTLMFRNELFNSTYPDFVLDAISSNLAVLKSPTCIRLSDGTLYGFEGSHAHGGCCEGSCTHVWNYVQSTAFLFPGLERSMREIDYKSNQNEHGKMFFRMLLPPGRNNDSQSNELAGTGKAAVDGQMGGVFKTYREWKISGDTQWLRKIWPKVKKALEFAWNPNNEDGWDLDSDGVMEGIQHHTLDTDLYGPNSYLTGYYMLALNTAAQMARALNDTSYIKYEKLYSQAYEWVNKNLFNGEYFHQLIDLKNADFPVDTEIGELKYQISEGCHIDQVISQWYSHILGVGYIFDQKKVKKALESIYENNFVRSFRNYPNPYRVYALNDERGTVMCTWPKGNMPKVPMPYAAECMTGFEYQVASHMIYEGLIDKGLTVVKAIRDRYDGEKRNPWNEIECGSNYARSMASYGLLLSLSGFKYNMCENFIGFDPKINEHEFYTFWCLNTGWGHYRKDNNLHTLKVQYGKLALSFVSLPQMTKIKYIYLNNDEIKFEICEERICIKNMIVMYTNDELKFFA